MRMLPTNPHMDLSHPLLPLGPWPIWWAARRRPQGKDPDLTGITAFIQAPLNQSPVCAQSERKRTQDELEASAYKKMCFSGTWRILRLFQGFFPYDSRNTYIIISYDKMKALLLCKCIIITMYLCKITIWEIFLYVWGKTCLKQKHEAYLKQHISL